ncbi:MAG TPA: hypothetical protein VJT50_15480 [Pyrinomonadaceae bacterium]|nr:hypothetical protein [Pyrinomonadaceae bacterium]
MNYLKYSLIALITFGAMLAVGPSAVVTAQQSTALERGYRTGYSDGYTAGYRDSVDHATRDYRNKPEYQSADRTYNQVWGTLDDYRDGYRQGFEKGYAIGFDRGPFDSSIPTDLGRRGSVDSDTDNSQDNAGATVNNPGVAGGNPGAPAGAPVFIPRDSMLTVELDSNLSTDVSQQGDPFQAHVIAPNEYAGATVEGRVTRVRRAGKVKGSSELQLSFTSIRMADGRTSALNASVAEIVPMTGSSDNGRVDSEGGVKGQGSTKDDVTKVGASTGVGALIGAIIGGGRGAAIGAAIGGSVGTAGVLTSRGKELRLDRGQQLKIRTANDTRIQ